MHFDSRRFMMAQVPFNSSETVKINKPMIKIMNDMGNLGVATANLKELGIYKELMSPDSRFLEIGCGSGYLLEHLYQKGKGQYFGIEPIKTESEKSKRRIRSYLKTKSKTEVNKVIRHGELRRVSFPKAQFNYIYSYHVFEHLENPLEMLYKAKSWLSVNGKVIVTCPNVEGWIPRQDLSKWRCAIPSHRWLPGKSALIRLFESEGYQIDELFTYGGYASPRKYWQEAANKFFKWSDLGDVICIMASVKV